MPTIKKTSIMALTTFLGLVAGTAEAASTVTYPAAQCAVLAGTPTVVLGSLQNHTASTVILSCPIDYDQSNSSVDVEIWAQDPDSNNDMECTLRRVRLTANGGISLVSSQPVSTSGFANTWQQLQTAGVSPGPDDTVLLHCEMPSQVNGLTFNIGNYQPHQF